MLIGRPATTGRRQALAPRMHQPLRRLALCLDCDECFEIGPPSCPACGGETWAPLARFLEIVPSEPLRRPAGRNGDRQGATGRRHDEREIARQLFIVSRHHLELYERVKRAFSGNETVQVVLDRRSRERRQDKISPVREQRRGDRRSRLDIDHQLRTIGWSIVLLDPAKGRRSPPR